MMMMSKRIPPRFGIYIYTCKAGHTHDALSEGECDSSRSTVYTTHTVHQPWDGEAVAGPLPASCLNPTPGLPASFLNPTPGLPTSCLKPAPGLQVGAGTEPGELEGGQVRTA